MDYQKHPNSFGNIVLRGHKIRFLFDVYLRYFRGWRVLCEIKNSIWKFGGNRFGGVISLEAFRFYVPRVPARRSRKFLNDDRFWKHLYSDVSFTSRQAKCMSYRDTLIEINFHHTSFYDPHRQRICC